MDNFKSLIATTRAPFLILTPACVSVGIGTAYWQTGEINLLHILLVFIGALSAHISANVFNEYYDFKSGLDMTTTRTRFSGGSGSLPANPDASSSVLYLAWLTLFVTAIIGTYFVYTQGTGLLPLGIFGLVLIVTYTTWWNYHPLLCLLSPGLGFGIIMVLGTHYALTGTYTMTAFMASLVPAFLACNLLLLNQFPDVEADRSVGRRHFPITIGLIASTRILGILFLLAYLTIIIGCMLSLIPAFTLLALPTALLALKSYTGAIKHRNNTTALLPYMGMNVLVNIATPALLALGLFIS